MNKRERKMKSRHERQERERARIRELNGMAEVSRNVARLLSSNSWGEPSADEMEQWRRRLEEERRRADERLRLLEEAKDRARQEMRDFTTRQLLSGLHATRSAGQESVWAFISGERTVFDYLDDKSAFDLILDEISRRETATGHERIRLARLDMRAEVAA